MLDVSTDELKRGKRYCVPKRIFVDIFLACKAKETTKIVVRSIRNERKLIIEKWSEILDTRKYRRTKK